MTLLILVFLMWPVVLLADLPVRELAGAGLKESVVEKTLAVVEGEMISLMDLKEARQRLKSGVLNDSVLRPLFTKSQWRKMPTKVLLELMIYEKLLDLSAEESKLTVGEKQLKREIDQQRRKKKLSKKAFSRWLVRNRFTSSSYRAFLRRSLLRKMFVQREIMEKIRISSADLNDYARRKEGKALFSTFEYDLSYLLFPSTEGGKKRAQRAFDMIKRDSSAFDRWALAEKEKKEFLQKIKLSALSKTIRQNIRKLSVGQVSSVLNLPGGYHIFKALWKTPIITARNQKRKARLSALLFEELFKQRLKNWLEERKKGSFIKTRWFSE